jgi:hypothetical protein
MSRQSKWTNWQKESYYIDADADQPMEIIADKWWRSVERLSFDLDTEAVLTRSEMALPMLI